MSNFQTLGAVDGTINGTAPTLFVASTTDNYATITAPGYLNDIAKKIKQNDIMFINFSDASVFPLYTGESSIFTELKVQYDPVLGNWNLITSNGNLNGLSAIAQAGVHSALYTNAGGSATTVLTDTRINANSIVLARWKSSANAVTVEKVTPTAGGLTVLSSGDPGASVLEYISIVPSVMLQNSGVHATQYNNAGGSATLVITDPLITAASIVNANTISSANAVNIDTVLPGAGILTIKFSADPGLSVIAYVSVTPSVALTALGVYGAAYTNAGGSATTTITDANILSTSIVTANWASQANASVIEKVTATAGTLTVLSSADPGASVLNYIATPVAE